jgi:hypothetical protein
MNVQFLRLGSRSGILTAAVFASVFLPGMASAQRDSGGLVPIRPERSLSGNADYELRALDAEAIIIPESALQSALDASGSFAVDEETKARAARLDAEVNEPGAVGIVGDLLQSSTPAKAFIREALCRRHGRGRLAGRADG